MIEFRVSVQNDVFIGRSFCEGFAQLLDDPIRRRMLSHVEVENPAAAMLDDEEAVECAEG